MPHRAGRSRRPNREKLFARANAVSPGGVQGEGRGATPYPLFMTRAQGSRIWDVDGNEFIDFHSSFGAVLLGHNDPRINAAVVRAMDEHGVSFSSANPLEVELAERLVTMIPSAERVVFSCTGTEATYHAIRLARGFTGRERILKFEGNYHGWHDYVAWSHHFATDEGGGVPTPVAASAGIPAAVRDLVEVREYNDARRRARAPRPRGRHDRRGHRRAGLPQRRRGPARARLPRGAARGVHRRGHAAHLRRGHHRLPARRRRRPGPVRGDTRSHDDGQGARQRLPDLGPGRPGGGHGPPRPEGRRALRGHVRRPDPQLRRRPRGHSHRARGLDPRAPDPPRRAPDLGHPGRHRRDRRPGPGPLDRRRLDGLLHGRAHPPLPRLRPVRDGQEPPGPARLPRTGSSSGGSTSTRTT